jgi:hypothetical protein
MNARDITLGMRVRVLAMLVRDAEVPDGEYGLQSWSWVREAVPSPIIGIVAAIRTKNDGGMTHDGDWESPSFTYSARSYMRAALVYHALHRKPVWALLDDIEEVSDGQA